MKCIICMPSSSFNVVAIKVFGPHALILLLGCSAAGWRSLSYATAVDETCAIAVRTIEK